MSYSIDAISDDCYPGSAVLINKFDIRDEVVLDEVETRIVSARTAEWSAQPRCETFDFAHYKAVHAYLFSELYDWAGQTRHVNISKKGTSFCDWQQLEQEAKRVFDGLGKRGYFQHLEHNAFVEEIVDFYCATNFLHPFREGNGRTQRVFLVQLINAVGYDIEFSNVDPDLLILATIQAAQGVSDNLRKVLSEAIR